MKPKRHGDLKRLEKRADEALHKEEWWDGTRWHPRDELPRTPAEGRNYKTALDVLAELSRTMIGDGDEPDSPERMRAANRFARSHEADRDYHASTEAEIEADKIFELAKPHLQGTRTPWTKLALRISLERKQDITPNRLRMICRQRGEN